MFTRRNPRGVALISMLMSLLIVGVLASMYLGPGGGAVNGKPWHVYQIERTRSAVLEMNLRAVNTQFAMMRMDLGGALTPEKIVELSRKLPNDTSGGRFYIDNEEVLTTRKVDVPLFRERLGI
jgi:hypothetical protein